MLGQSRVRTCDINSLTQPPNWFDLQLLTGNFKSNQLPLKLKQFIKLKIIE